MASRFWIAGGTNSNWNASPTSNWCATSGGTTRVAVPTISDDVTFDGAGTNGNTASVVSAAISVLSLTFTSGYTSTITINSGITLSIAGNFTDQTTHGWAVGSVTSSAITITTTSTITSNGKTFPGSVTFNGVVTHTLTGDWTIAGNVTCNSVKVLNGGNLYCGGNWSNGGSTTGTSKLIMNGAGSFSTPGVLNINVDFNGTITASGTQNYGTGTMTLVGGTVTVASGCTFNITPACTFNMSPTVFYNIQLAASGTYTINSLLSVSNTLTCSGNVNVTFAGTAGFSANIFQDTTTAVGATITFKNGVTYTITGAFNSNLAPNATLPTYTSDDATLKAILTLNFGATCNVSAKFTRIDASAGRPIRSYNGTITSCNNIVSFHDLPTAGLANAA